MCQSFGKCICFALFLAILLQSCATHRPKGVFDAQNVGTPPDYGKEDCWAALPWRHDLADTVPNGLVDAQATAAVDVFFLYPTAYTGKRGDRQWNAPIDDAKINDRILEGSVQFQASIFNGVGRVFVPYYRQAHLNAYFNKDTTSAKLAFELAYSDVKAAFDYYLANYNQGRPIIIASHSQGTTHSIQLLKEYFDGKPLYDQLVVAYMLGIPVQESAYQTINPCQSPDELGCYCAWRTFKEGAKGPPSAPDVVVTNPLSWTTDEMLVPANQNEGAVLVPFETIIPKAASAQRNGAILWVSKPKFKGSWLLLGKNYHAGDFNIFYMNVRNNAAQRVQRFLAR